MLLDKLGSLSLLLERPGRYLGRELNARSKDWEKNPCRILLLFPDVYEVGMSHLGLRIIYHILNSIEGVLADRAYLPWVDALHSMNKGDVPLWGLDTGRPACDFSVIEVSLPAELLYTNFLKALDISCIPLLACERDAKDPIVIAGGAAVVNPVPIAPFSDLVFIGESEEAQVEIAQTVLDSLSGGISREGQIELLARIEGMWSPAVGGKVKRRIVLDLDKASFPGEILLPLISPLHDRVAVEIMRGCSRGCRFCQAGFQYRPVRERSVSTVLGLVGRCLSSTGYDEVSLLSLSATDHSGIHDIIKTLMEEGEKSFVSLSLPSLRSGSLTLDIIQRIRSVRKTSFTMAPEAGTQRLRNVVNKNITESEIMDTVDKIFSGGWDLMKLYFMMGLPTETEEDLEAIADLVCRVMARARRVSSRRPRLRVSVSPFVPKPHTPFQWEPQDTLENFKRKSAIIRRLIPRKGIDLSIHNPYQSLIEALLARGGEESKFLLSTAYGKGAFYDQWGEYFNFSLWEKAMEEFDLDLDLLLYRSRDKGESFPWDFVDMGFTKEFLWKEREKALNGITTPDCRESCSGCGLCNNVVKHVSPKGGQIEISFPHFGRDVVSRLRVWLSFRGKGALLGHNDFVRYFVRLLRRSRVPLAYKGRFNPQARVIFALALPLGMESDAEPCDLFLTSPVNPGEIAKRIGSFLPPGINVVEERTVPLDALSLGKSIEAIHYTVHMPGEILLSPFTDTIQTSLEKVPGLEKLKVDVEAQCVSFVAVPVDGAFVKPYELVKEHFPVVSGKERAAQIIRSIKLMEV